MKVVKVDKGCHWEVELLSDREKSLIGELEGRRKDDNSRRIPSECGSSECINNSVRERGHGRSQDEFESKHGRAAESLRRSNRLAYFPGLFVSGSFHITRARVPSHQSRRFGFPALLEADQYPSRGKFVSIFSP